jgi:hypothetical protein
MKKQILFFTTMSLLILSSSTLLNAQQSTFAKIYDHSFQVQAYSIVKTFDNKYLIAGTESNEALVFKIDTSGDIIWKKKLGSNNNECFKSLITTLDSSYVIAGNIFNTVDSTSDLLCVKINSNGDTLWTKEIDMGFNEYALSVQQTSDNGYILAGNSGQDSIPLTKIAVVKLDSTGNLMWGNTYSIVGYNSCANSVKQLPDSGYIIIGYFDSLSTYDNRTFLMKLNANGNISWTKIQMVSANYTVGWDINVTNDGLMCYFGTGLDQCGIMKTDFSGNVVWSKKYNVNINDYFNPVLRLYSVSNSEYMFNAGSTLIKIDTAGIPFWSKGGYFPESINDFTLDQDKGYTIIGIPAMLTKTFGYINILRTDTSGYIANSNCSLWNGTITHTLFPINLTSAVSISAPTAFTVLSHPAFANSLLTIYGNGCIIGSIEESKTDKNTLKVFPDPAADNITIELLDNNSENEISIYNIQGQLILHRAISGGKTGLDISSFVKGFYMIKVINGNKIETTKFVKE